MKPVAPNSDWQVPTELPDLRRAGIIALDTETNDDGLRADRGPAWPWRGGYVCGVSVAYYADGGIRAHYFPLRHPDTDNFDPAQVFGWLKDLVASDVRFVTQNGLYDWGWLRAEADILMPPVRAARGDRRARDPHRRKPLLLRPRRALCLARPSRQRRRRCCSRRSRPRGLRRSARRSTPRRTSGNCRRAMSGPMPRPMRRNTLALWENLDPILDREGTRDAYRLEIDLLPMVHEMRRRGIRIDQTAAEQARDLILRKRDGVLAELSEKLGTERRHGRDRQPEMEGANVRPARHHLSAHGERQSVVQGRKNRMDGRPSALAAAAHCARPTKYNNAATRFLEGHILDHIINGRIHSEIHPHRSDDGGGTCSLRFSYSDPPLQQMPSRDKELAPLIRGVFLPEEGEVWAKPDISQQEFRFVVHYAVLRNLPRAKEAAELYRTDPDADFHAMVADMTGLERESAKAANFAKIFGAGVEKFAEMIGKPLHEARAIYHQYDRELPFVSPPLRHLPARGQAARLHRAL